MQSRWFINKYNLLTIVLLLNCSSNPHYWKNRKNDVLDIANIAIEREYYGVRLHFLFFPLNLAYESKAKGYGLMHGRWGEYRSGDDKNRLVVVDRLFFYKSTYIGDHLSSGMYQIIGEAENRDYQKEYKYLILDERACHSKGRAIYGNEYYICRSILENSLYHYFSDWRIELAFGYNYGFRVGFSISEFLDLVFGTVGFDLRKDDYDKYGNLQKLSRRLPDKILTKEEVEEYIQDFAELNNGHNLNRDSFRR
jgi:hypothetical protein